MIDPELVTRKALLITRDLEALDPLARTERGRYLADRSQQAAAERYLERIIGRMIDVNYHLITQSGHPPPADYYQSFLHLGQIGIVSPEFARRIAACTGLRNRLVHEYDEIDPVKIHDALQGAMRDVPEYLQQVDRYVARVAGGS
jgi:uncharacterized protein YutE (UPF0331/DUF86 family)